jgi:ferredoxin
MRYLEKTQFQSFFDTLEKHGYQCVAPVVKDKTIQYLPIQSSDEMAKGVTDHQSPGKYRLNLKSSDLWFDWANGAQLFKPWFFKAEELLWTATKKEAGLGFEESRIETSKIAFIGARACDLAALKLQDAHFKSDPYYQQRRAGHLIIAVNCSTSSEDCFCASTGDGPECKQGFDILLSELTDGFIIEWANPLAESIVASLKTDEVTQEQIKLKQQNIDKAAVQQRAISGEKISEALLKSKNEPIWQQMSDTCLACGNCTMVCPTCFCHRQEEQMEFGGKQSNHYRYWDSCFTDGHSYIGGFLIRKDTAARYQQWLGHKMGWWNQQYGRSGCVGCGRCMTWCPAGIDFVAMVNRAVSHEL